MGQKKYIHGNLTLRRPQHHYRPQPLYFPRGANKRNIYVEMRPADRDRPPPKEKENVGETKVSTHFLSYLMDGTVHPPKYCQPL